MGQIRHGSATTTHAVRAALQRSQASLAQLIQDLGINPKTVAKWHGITRLPDVEGDKPGAKSSKATRLGSFILISQRFRQLKYGEGQETVRGAVFLNGGQVERMNRTIKDATVKRFHNDSHDQLRTHLADFLAAYNFARRLKTLNGLTPDEYICKIRTSEPDRFILNPIHQMSGLNT